MIILDGEKLSEELLGKIRQEIEKKQLCLKLAVVLAGDNLVSKSYINKKQRAAKAAGISFDFFSFPESISEENLKKEIEKLADDKNISGIVVQLPLPENINSRQILNLVPKEKDADVLSEYVFNEFAQNKTEIFPPVVGAIKHLLEKYKIDIKSKKIVLIGKGQLVGKPVSAWLSNLKADFTVLDRSVKDISLDLKNADIIISGAGSPEIVKKDMIKQGAVLIDAGTSSEDGKIKGDIEKEAYKKASYVAPVPGGVGPMTIACLLENILKLNK